MADDLNRRKPEDPKKININQPWEVSYWTSKFGISESKLRRAVKAVGPMAADVKAWLDRN